MGKSEKHRCDWKPTMCQAVLDARAFYRHTTLIMANPKVFKPEKDFMGSTILRIQAEALEAYLTAWKANRINLTYRPELLQERLSLQREALDHFETLLPLLELAKPMFHLRSKKFWNWMEMLVNTGKKLRAWHESDRKKEAKQAELSLPDDAQYGLDTQDGSRLNTARRGSVAVR